MTNKATANTQPLSKKPMPHKAQVKLVSHSGRYSIGTPKRPSIVHDNGFLDKFSHREPTIGDKAAYMKWKAELAGAKILHPDWVDATAAYEHFLGASGTARTVNYKKFLETDPGGQEVLKYITNDFQNHVEIIGENRTHFSVTSDVYAIGGHDINLPYPKTINWQRAIGAHPAWVSGDVEISYDKSVNADVYTATITIHMEDMYNFNPGSKDIATGIPDSENGIFEITGLAKQYLNVGAYTFTTRWIEGRKPNPFGVLK